MKVKAAMERTMEWDRAKRIRKMEKIIAVANNT
jgi:hypothetical protein